MTYFHWGMLGLSFLILWCAGLIRIIPRAWTEKRAKEELAKLLSKEPGVFK